MRPYAYASTPDVLRHLTVATGFTASSRPSATQVHHHLLTAADELDAALGEARYTVPVATGATAAWGVLGQYNSIGAALYVTSGHPAGEDSKHQKFLERRWNAILKGITDGDIPIPGADQDSTTTLGRFGAARNATITASAYFTREIVV